MAFRAILSGLDGRTLSGGRGGVDMSLSDGLTRPCSVPPRVCRKVVGRPVDAGDSRRTHRPGDSSREADINGGLHRSTVRTQFISHCVVVKLCFRREKTRRSMRSY